MPEVRETGLPATAEDAIRSVFARHRHVERVILYGSRAMGTYRDASDIDFTIEGDDVSFDELLRIDDELDDLLLPWKIDLSLRRQIDNAALQDHIERVGIAFYRKSSTHNA